MAILSNSIYRIRGLCSACISLESGAVERVRLAEMLGVYDVNQVPTP
jgi:hypothetical protein